MSFFKKMLSSVGIGSAKVDTILEKNQFEQGETIEAIVKIKGGKVEQQIQGLYFSVHSTYEGTVMKRDQQTGEMEEEDVTRTAVILKTKLSDEFTLHPSEEKEIPISLTLPLFTPLTVGKTKVWIHTGLDIPKAIDSGDRDDIKVLPEKKVKALFRALEELGFVLREAECEEAGTNLHGGPPFVQEFEFKPMSGNFRSKLDELEIVVFPFEEEAEVFMTIDRKARGFGSYLSQMTGRNEEMIKFVFTEDDIPHLADMIGDLIEDRL